MLKDFVTYRVAVELYQVLKRTKISSADLRNQLLRASSSIVLNLAEGSGRRTKDDQRRHYTIALGSLRECQAIFEMEEMKSEKIQILFDRLGAMIFVLASPNKEHVKRQ